MRMPRPLPQSCGRCRARITRWEVAVEEHPKYGPGRPSAKQPRVIKALRYGLQVTLHERSEVIARKRQETSCFVLLTNVPTVGEMAHPARAVLQAYKEQHGIDQTTAS